MTYQRSQHLRRRVTVLTFLSFWLLISGCMASFQSDVLLLGKIIKKSPATSSSRLLLPKSWNRNSSNQSLMMTSKKSFFQRRIRRRRRRSRNQRKGEDTTTVDDDTLSVILPEYDNPLPSSMMKKTDFRQSFLESYQQTSAILKGITNKNGSSNTTTNTTSSLLSSIPPRELVRKKDRSILSFLPPNILNGTMPLKTEDLLIHLTWEYMNVDNNNPLINMRNNPDVNVSQNEKEEQASIDMQKILIIIDEEYKFVDVPYTVGDSSYLNGSNDKGSGEMDRRNARINISKILSFAALYRLPSEIVLTILQLLLDKITTNDDLSHAKNEFQEDGFHNETITMIQKVMQDFEKDGWKSVAFPKGLSIRLESNKSTKKRFSISRIVTTPIRSIRNTKVLRKHATMAIREALSVKPPQKIKVKNVDVLHKLDESLRVLMKSDYASYWKGLLQTSFPSKQRFKQRWRSLLRQIEKDKKRHKVFVVAAALLFSYTVFTIYKGIMLRSLKASLLV